MQVGVLRLCKDKCTSSTCASTFSLALISCFSLLRQADSSTCRIVKTFVHLSVSHSTIFWEYFVFQNVHVLIFRVDKVLYKWTYGTKNCWSTIIVSVWVLVCLLLFRLATNRDNEAILIPLLYYCNVVAVRSNRRSDYYLVTSLLTRVIACECRHRDKSPLRLERPFLGFK